MPDYRDTVILPKTDFGMRYDAKIEKKILDNWLTQFLYETVSERNTNKPKFILHDGPPYANGHIHMGTALNKILKDIVVRFQRMMGNDAPFVPGWDCHGLPIEWKIEQKYREKGINKDTVPVLEFRQECREFAQKWLDIQRDEFKKLGVMADWDNPYTTMDFKSEANIVRELGKFLMNGKLYQGKKSVMWSVVEKTTLSEAEIEYHNHTSTAIYVKFEMAKPWPKNTYVVIWTTTPWTIPANRAVAYGPDVEYCLLETEHGDLIVARDRVEHFVSTTGIGANFDLLDTFLGSNLEGSRAYHPLGDHLVGYEFSVPLLPADFVTTDQGTGLVHIAPSHGEDDFNLGLQFNLEVPDSVGPDGMMQLPGYYNTHVFKANPIVIRDLADNCLGQESYVHSYPHSWRSKAPLIQRATSQWFIDLDNGLRSTALEAIDDTTWLPKTGRNRIRSMVDKRPDWCVSRQRIWGVPIAIFVNKVTGVPLRDETVMERIATTFEKEGADAWWSHDAQYFLGDDYDANDYTKVTDILDVWFDSGCTHSFVLKERQELSWPADLYLEGSDQHRGWFQASLLESCGTNGVAPYKTVLTHGFVVDAKGLKMSKSGGNVMSPFDLTKTFGVDVLRLWTVMGDFTDDLRVGKEILNGISEHYRKIRNTMKFIIGNLTNFSDNDKVDILDMPELEQWVLDQLYQLDTQIRICHSNYDFNKMYSLLFNFCSNELSSFYFDIRKDSLYCDSVNDIKHRSTKTVLDIIFHFLVKWLSPVFVVMTEELWTKRYTDSVHLQQFDVISSTWCNIELREKWTKVRQIKKVVSGAIEVSRQKELIKNNMQVKAVIFTKDDFNIDFAETCVVSAYDTKISTVPSDAFVLDEVPDVGVIIMVSEGNKCDRCWKILVEVAPETNLCHRCDKVICGQ